jgi:hypothetical protein
MLVAGVGADDDRIPGSAHERPLPRVRRDRCHVRAFPQMADRGDRRRRQEPRAQRRLRTPPSGAAWNWSRTSWNAWPPWAGQPCTTTPVPCHRWSAPPAPGSRRCAPGTRRTPTGIPGAGTPRRPCSPGGTGPGGRGGRTAAASRTPRTSSGPARPSTAAAGSPSRTWSTPRTIWTCPPRYTSASRNRAPECSCLRAAGPAGAVTDDEVQRRTETYQGIKGPAEGTPQIFRRAVSAMCAVGARTVFLAGRDADEEPMRILGVSAGRDPVAETAGTRAIAERNNLEIVTAAAVDALRWRAARSGDDQVPQGLRALRLVLRPVSRRPHRCRHRRVRRPGQRHRRREPRSRGRPPVLGRDPA